MNEQELIDWLFEYKEKQFEKVDFLNEDGKSLELFEANITEAIVDEIIEKLTGVTYRAEYEDVNS